MSEKKPGRPKSEQLKNSSRKSFWIPNVFLKDKPSQMSDSNWIRKLIKEGLNGSTKEADFLAEVINKFILIFIEQEVKSENITFTDKEYDFIMKKIEELQENESESY